MHLQDDRNELLDVCQSNPDMLWIAKVSSGAKGRLVIHQFIFIQSVFSHPMVLSQNERNVFVWQNHSMYEVPSIMKGFYLIYFFLLRHVAVLVNGPPKPEACWSCRS